MHNNDTVFLIALNHFPKFGQSRLKKLKAYFPSWKTAFESSLAELVQAGIKEPIASEFIAAKSNIKVEKMLELMNKEEIEVVETGCPNYSNLLSEIYDPPALLFYKGDISLLNTVGLGIVGSRKNTPYGQQACSSLCSSLVKNNFTIISGLALGIDSIAHNSAIENNGKTIAVLGSGIDKESIYPSSNRYLSDKIISRGGLIVSEFSLGSAPLPYNFPMRNRIISGLSLGVLVVESAKKSGALITARFALEQNREVFAVPGSIFSSASDGPNNLIKEGATPTSSVDIILETLDLKRQNSYIKSKKITPENKEEEKIISELSYEPIHIDELVRLSGLSTSELSSTLTLMEMRGVIKNFGNMKYALS